MNTYLVGGAVRDTLLGLPVTERDYVVVGSTVAEMLELGFRQVGQDFPVFLHPETAEEYALARTERKRGHGHRGFVVHAAPEITLEEDLLRRDLTINAMAMTASGEVIDPYGGQEDLAAGVLRHVSPAFSEDPLRVFRVARFAARFRAFTVAPETLACMRAIVSSGELATLSAERVWVEFRKSLELDATRFLEVLALVGGLADWLPELAGVRPQRPLQGSAEQRFACLLQPLTQAQRKGLCSRLRVPKRFAQLADRLSLYGALFSTWRNADALTLISAVQSMRLFQDPDAMQMLIETVEYAHDVELAALSSALRQAGEAVGPQQFPGVTGPALGKALSRERAKALKRMQDTRSAE